MISSYEATSNTVNTEPVNTKENMKEIIRSLLNILYGKKWKTFNTPLAPIPVFLKIVVP